MSWEPNEGKRYRARRSTFSRRKKKGHDYIYIHTHTYIHIYMCVYIWLSIVGWLIPNNKTIALV